MESNVNEMKIEPQRIGVSGLGGWLVLIQIGLYLTIFGLVNLIFGYYLSPTMNESWIFLTSEDSALYDPLWKPILIFEAMYNVFLLVFIIFILVQFYRKKSILPRLMIIFYSLSLFIGITDYILLQQISLANQIEDVSSIRDLLKSILVCLIWIPYFLKSERVKNTFIR